MTSQAHLLVSYYYDISSDGVPGVPVNTICHGLELDRSGNHTTDDLEKVFLGSILRADLRGSGYYAYIRLVNEGKICIKLAFDSSLNWTLSGENEFKSEFKVGPGSISVIFKCYWLRVSEKVWKSSLYRFDATKNPQVLVYRLLEPKKMKVKRTFYASKA
ncbi:U2 protein [Beatrice Hill virus]|uniref:U2 protein n=1 Tax=Beatrice Hill virus TaxID=1819301 RepID=A0A1J0F5E3_9RHAB|nr:U2 protein [Beatrice Hill virus]APC23642.1 U2 protein [Beatrice Hill virus]